MRSHRFAIAGVALMASSILISCGSDKNNAPANSGVPIVADSTIATVSTGSSTQSSVEGSTVGSQP